MGDAGNLNPFHISRGVNDGFADDSFGVVVNDAAFNRRIRKTTVAERLNPPATHSKNRVADSDHSHAALAVDQSTESVTGVPGVRADFC